MQARLEAVQRRDEVAVQLSVTETAGEALVLQCCLLVFDSQGGLLTQVLVWTKASKSESNLIIFKV